MQSFETIDLGTYRGDNYFLAGFVEPDPSDQDSFDPNQDATGYGVAVVRRPSTPLEDNLQIVRMDNAHGRPHLDKIYLPPDAEEEKKDWLNEGYSYKRMKRYLQESWTVFVNLYIRHNE